MKREDRKRTIKQLVAYRAFVREQQMMMATWLHHLKTTPDTQFHFPLGQELAQVLTHNAHATLEALGKLQTQITDYETVLNNEAEMERYRE